MAQSFDAKLKDGKIVGIKNHTSALYPNLWLEKSLVEKCVLSKVRNGKKHTIVSGSYVGEKLADKD